MLATQHIQHHLGNFQNPQHFQHLPSQSQTIMAGPGGCIWTPEHAPHHIPHTSHQTPHTPQNPHPHFQLQQLPHVPQHQSHNNVLPGGCIYTPGQSQHLPHAPIPTNDTMSTHQAHQTRGWSVDVNPQVNVNGGGGHPTSIQVGGSIGISNPTHTNTIDVHGSSTWVNGHSAGNNIGVGWTVHF